MVFKSQLVSLVTLFGHQASGITPLGVYIKTSRFGKFSPSAAARSDDKSGRATAAPPAARRKWRRLSSGLLRTRFITGLPKWQGDNGKRRSASQRPTAP